MASSLQIKVMSKCEHTYVSVYTCVWVCEVAQSYLTLCDPVDCSPLSMGFSRQEYWSGLPFPSPGDLPNPGIKPRSPALQADAYPLSHQGSPVYIYIGMFFFFFFFIPIYRYKLPVWLYALKSVKIIGLELTKLLTFKKANAREKAHYFLTKLQGEPLTIRSVHIPT